MYADDIVLMCKDEMEARQGITIIRRWAKDEGFIINEKKSGVMVIRKRKVQRPQGIALNGIPYVS